MARYFKIKNGLLEWQGRRYPLDFTVTLTKAGSVSITLSPHKDQGRDEQLDLFHALHRGETRTVPFFHLSGTTADDIAVTTNSASLQGFKQRHGRSGITIMPRATAAEIHFAYPHPPVPKERELTATYWSRGQFGHLRISTETPLGTLSIAGPPRPKRGRVQFGDVTIESPPTTTALEAWLSDCDAATARMLDLLSLAQGQRIQWTARDVFSDETLITKCIRPRTAPQANLAHLFYPVHLDPVLELFESYTPELIEATGLRVAISWMVSPAGTKEMRYLNLMVALEHLVTILRPKLQGVMDKRRFKTDVRPHLVGTIETAHAAKTLTDEQARIFTSKLHNLNSPVHLDGVKQLLAYYRVPIADIEDDLKAVLQWRNELVHRGLFHTLSADRTGIYRYSDIAEELLKRTVLAILDYTGRYISPLYNLDDRDLTHDAN